MPYKLDGDCVVRADTGETVKCHDSHAAAVAHLGALMANVNHSIATRWVEPFNYAPGQPFRIMPIGEFKRGDRTLNITKEDVSQMAANYERMAPRWKIPLYAGHPTDANQDPPKLGNVAKLEVRDDGLYATPELSAEGQKLIGGGGYQYSSPGVLWSKNGSKYTDDQGKEWENVIDHVALTNRPFFGAKTALFSAEPLEAMMDMPANVKEKLDKLPAPMAEAIKKKLEGMSPAEMEAHMSKMSDLTGAPDAADGVSKGAETMAETKIEATPPAPETMSADRFAAYKADAEAKQAKLAEQLTEVQKQAETFAAQLATEKDSRRKVELLHRYEGFSVGEKADILADKFLALEKKDPDLFAYFDAVFEKFDAAVKAGDLFAQISKPAGSENADTLEVFTEKLLGEKFGGDRAKYGEAFAMAESLRPELAEEYKHRPSAK